MLLAAAYLFTTANHARRWCLIAALSSHWYGKGSLCSGVGHAASHRMHALPDLKPDASRRYQPLLHYALARIRMLSKPTPVGEETCRRLLLKRKVIEVQTAAVPDGHRAGHAPGVYAGAEVASRPLPVDLCVVLEA